MVSVIMLKQCNIVILNSGLYNIKKKKLYNTIQILDFLTSYILELKCKTN